MSEEPITIQTPARRMVTWLIRVVVGFVFLFLLVFLLGGGLLFVFEAPFHFLAGWFLHAGKALPPLLAKWPGILLPAGCLVLAGILIHRFIRRCLTVNKSSLAWRPANTVASIALLLLGCGAAIALSGVVHQTVWLMGERWTTNNHRTSLSYAIRNGRQLMMALTEYFEEYGRYPTSFQELDTELELSSKLAWVKYRSGSLREPFILLYPGGKREVNANEPLIVSPVIQESGKIVVGYGDMSVKAVPAEQLEQILRARALPEAQPAGSR